MPAVGVVDGGWVVGEVFEGVDEGGEADDLVEGISEVGEGRKGGGEEGNRSYVDGGGEGSGLGGVETLEGVFVGHYITEGILPLDLFIQCLSVYYIIQYSILKCNVQVL